MPPALHVERVSLMAKVKGNTSNTTGFFVSPRGRKPKEVVKNTVTKSSGGRSGLRRVNAETRVGVYKQ